MPIPIGIAVTEQYLGFSNAAFKSATLLSYICQDFSSFHIFTACFLRQCTKLQPSVTCSSFFHIRSLLIGILVFLNKDFSPSKNVRERRGRQTDRYSHTLTSILYCFLLQAKIMTFEKSHLIKLPII